MLIYMTLCFPLPPRHHPTPSLNIYHGHSSVPSKLKLYISQIYNTTKHIVLSLPPPQYTPKTRQTNLQQIHTFQQCHAFLTQIV